MKNKTRSIALSIVLALAITLLLPVFAPVISYAADDVIYISNADELVEFAKKCSYDSWSVGKKFALKNDISLEGVDFEPAASFGGSFDGQGHSITGLKVSGAFSPAGLFATITADATITNLSVNGVVSPDGDKGYVGGIAGVNYGRIENCSFNGTVIGHSDVGGIVGINKLSGTVSNCSASGEIIGENRTGGIVGLNEGLISSSENKAKVNTISLDSSISLEDLNFSLTLDITKLPSFTTSSMNDTGGIAGYTSGIIMGCINNAAVGYPHVGYNVGGIAGRSNGHLTSNANNGVINGRKDVGGIVGQIEPYVSYELSEDLLLSLKTELDLLGQVIEGALGTTGGSIPTVSTRLNNILVNLDYATNSLNVLLNDVTGFGNEFIGEVNRIGEILSQVMTQIYEITEYMPELANVLNSCLVNLEDALMDLEEFAEATEGAISDIASATDDASNSLEMIGSSINNLNLALTAFKNSITINDKDAAKASLDLIVAELTNLVNGADNFATALSGVVSVLKNAAWADDLIDEIESLIYIFNDLSESAVIIYESIETIRDNIDIHWDKISEASDELIAFIGHITDMSVNMVDAMELIESGLGNISDGFDVVLDAIEIKDVDEIKAGLDLIETGFDQLIEAGEEYSDSIAQIGQLLDDFAIENLEEIMPGITEAFGTMAGALSGMTEAIVNLSEGAGKLVENIRFDFDSMREGGALIILGIDDVVASISYISDAIADFSQAMTSLENAIYALKEAVEIGDENQISIALSNLSNAIGDIIYAGGEITDLLTDMTETLRDAKIWGDDLVDAIAMVTDAISQMTNALVMIQSGVDSLYENIGFDLDTAEEGLSLINQGLSDLSDAAYLLSGCFGHITDALEKLDFGSEHLNSAITNLRESIYCMSVAMGMLEDMSVSINSMIGYLKDVDPIFFPTLSDSTIDTANQLFAYISVIENELKYLNADITNLSSDLVESLSKINEIFTHISDDLLETIYGLNSDAFIDSSVTETEINEITNGKLFDCVNNGQVTGDKNVGGIGGTMGLEYVLDPEDDLTGELSVTQKKQYKVKAVIHACVNNGNVSAKKDNVGGIVGKMDLGLIYGAENFCQVKSETGNYVGGIAGITAGLISQCYAKCSLDGNKYVGGIVGSGTTETVSGGSSMVRNCYSMVYINSFTQYAGAISGVNAGEYSENLFVSDILAGIDRVSYAGKAEPISYEDLIKRRSISDGFYNFTIKFIADGVILHSIDFEYGASFDSSVFPEIPVKDGYYGYWDRTDLTGLVFDTTVRVVYKPYVTALDSEEKRDNGRQLFFVEGEFIEGDKLIVKNGCDTSSLVLEDSFFTQYTLVESYILTIPEDNLEVNQIHFLPSSDNCQVYVKMGGSWYDVNAKEFGSYLVFNAEGGEVEIAIVQKTIKLVPVLALAGAAFVLILTVVIVIIVKNKKKKATEPKEENKENSNKTDKK